MRKALCCLAVFVVACLPLFGKDQRPATPEKRADTPDEALLKRAGLQLTEDKLIAYLQQRTGEDSDLLRIKQLVHQLGADAFEDREEASRKLVLLGKSALTELRRAQNDADPEIARRGSLCLQALGKDRNEILAVIRLLSQTASTDTTRGLLRFLPYALDEQMEEEIWFALDAVACKQRLVNAVPTTLLIDPLPVRRAAAGYLLARRGGARERKAAQKLLIDTNATVRLRVAQGLLGARDASGVPALIALLDQPSVTLGWQAEELLHWAASNDAPTEVLNTGTATERERCRQAWEKWWHQNAASLDLTRPELDTRRPGLILVVPKPQPGSERAFLCGWDGIPRWRWPRESAVRNLHLLGNDRFLVIEERAAPPKQSEQGEVPERIELGFLECSPTGRIFQEFNSKAYPIVCLRLWNGNTLVVNSTEDRDYSRVENVEEINPKGKRVFKRDLVAPMETNPPTNKLMHPVILSNARLLYGKSNQQNVEDLVEVDPVTGEVCKQIHCEKSITFRNLEHLENWHTLIVTLLDAEVLEVDEKGKIVWKYARPKGANNEEAIESAVRLRNGNTLICCRSWVWGHQVIVVDKAGKVAWRIPTPDFSSVQPCLGMVRLGFDSPYPDDFDLEYSVAWNSKGLTHKNSDVRKLFAIQMEKLGPKAKKAIPALIEALDDPRIRPDVESALNTMVGPDDLPLLLKAAKDGRPGVRAGAIHMFAANVIQEKKLTYIYLKDGKVIVPVLLDALRDNNPDVRISAINACVPFKDQARVIVPALIKLFHDKDVRGYAMHNVGSCFRAEARVAVPALFEIARTGDRHGVVEALSSLDTICTAHPSIVPNYVDLLTNILKSNERIQVWGSAVCHIGQLGPRARMAVPTLHKLMDRQIAELSQLVKDESPTSLYSVTESGLVGVLNALAAIGPDANKALPSVKKALQVGGQNVRDAATKAIVAIQR